MKMFLLNGCVRLKRGVVTGIDTCQYQKFQTWYRSIKYFGIESPITTIFPALCSGGKAVPIIPQNYAGILGAGLFLINHRF